MMNSQYANPNRTIDGLKTIRIRSGATSSSVTMSLLDSGADTCLAGAEFHIEEESDEVVHVIGFQDHMKSKDMKIGTAITATTTTSGKTILLRASNVILGMTGDSLISTGQVENYNHVVDLRPRTKGGRQRTFLSDGYTLPLIHTGPHMYLQCRLPTETELADETLPTVELTSPIGWDPAEVENKNEVSEGDDLATEAHLDIMKTEKLS
ncbi:MAG: hypothetical protein ACREBR_02430 [bacterium]